MPVKKPSKRTGVQLGEQMVRGMVMMAGAKVFAQHGYRAASVEDLLASANISRRTFYKAFSSKDDVGLALYKFGTDNLLRASQVALSDDADLLTKITRCIDLHLGNTGTMGRLVYVLGGEASHQDSPMFTARMAVHDQFVEMLLAAGGMRVDPLFVRTMASSARMSVRSVLIMSDEGRKVTAENIARARAVMVRITSGAIAGDGPLVAPMPQWP